MQQSAWVDGWRFLFAPSMRPMFCMAEDFSEATSRARKARQSPST